MTALALGTDEEHSKAVIELRDVINAPHSIRIAKQFRCCKSSAGTARLLDKSIQAVAISISAKAPGEHARAPAAQLGRGPVSGLSCKLKTGVT